MPDNGTVTLESNESISPLTRRTAKFVSRIGTGWTLVLAALVGEALSCFVAWLIVIAWGHTEELTHILVVAFIVSTIVVPLLSLFLIRLVFAIEKMQQELHEATVRDTLTQLYNRVYFLNRLESAVDYARRSGESVSLLMVDVDHFKHVNDAHGHLAGDQALRSFAAACTRMLRSYDVVARFGGEEFMVLLPNTNSTIACDVAERLRRITEQTVIQTDNSVTFCITVSIGVATWGPRSESAHAMLAQADTALYQAKHQGRNRWVAAVS